MRRGLTRALGLAALAAAAVTAAGCGGGNATVRGKVTYMGKAVVWGTVTLVDRTGLYHTADIDLGGNYSLPKVPQGSVKIAVSSPNPDPAGGRGGGGGGGGGKGKIGGLEDPREKFKTNAGEDRPKPPAGAWFEIPKKYIDPATSELTGEVKGGTAEINIDLK